MKTPVIPVVIPAIALVSSAAISHPLPEGTYLKIDPNNLFEVSIAEPISAETVEIQLDGPIAAGGLRDYTHGPVEWFELADTHPPEFGSVTISRETGEFTYKAGHDFSCKDGDLFAFIAANSKGQSDIGYVGIVCKSRDISEITPIDKPEIKPLEKGFSEIPRMYTPAYSEQDSAPDLRVPYPTDLVVYKKPDSERFEDAILNLAEKTNGVGGVIEFTGTPQCDTIYLSNKLKTKYLVLRGVNSEHDFLTAEGKIKKVAQPRIYCRGDDDRLAGTIPQDWLKQNAGRFLVVPSSNVNPNIWLENFEVDGYNQMVSLGDTGVIQLWKIYGHSGLNDGITSTNSGWANHPDGFLASLDEDECNLNLTFWQTELSHWGQGNYKHNAYTHGCIGGAKDTGIVEKLQSVFGPEYNLPGVYPDHKTTVSLLDSVWHSPRDSSVFKSLADEVNIINTKLCTNAKVCSVQDHLPLDNSKAVIDIAAMSNVTVRDSEIVCYKNNYEGGGLCASARQRKTALRGGRVPAVWFPYFTGWNYTDEGVKYSQIPERLVPDSPVHTEGFWSALNGQKWYTWRYNNTVFRNIVEPGTFMENPAFTIYPTAWVYDGGRGQDDCKLPMPKTAYDLVQYLFQKVDFLGFKENIHVYDEFIHNDRCAYDPPEDYPTVEGFKRFGIVEVSE